MTDGSRFYLLSFEKSTVIGYTLPLIDLAFLKKWSKFVILGSRKTIIPGTFNTDSEKCTGELVLTDCIIVFFFLQ